MFWIIVRQLHREFLRAGADVMQAFTFSMDDDLGGEQAKHGVCIAVLWFRTKQNNTTLFKEGGIITIFIIQFSNLQSSIHRIAVGSHLYKLFEHKEAEWLSVLWHQT